MFNSSQDFEPMKINLKYIEDIEAAIGYNSASTHGYAERKIKDLLITLLQNKSIIIEDIGVEIKTVEEYKMWKKIENVSICSIQKN